MTPVDPRFMPKLDTLLDLLHHHIEHEKNEDMPRLEGLLSRAESEDLARQFQRTKLITPTRSHPGAPNSLIPETLAGLLIAPVDKLRDLLADWPNEGDKEEVEKREGKGSKI